MQQITTLPQIRERNPSSHKGEFGRVFVAAGSTGMTGAAYLSSKAALRSGAGLVTLGIPEGLNAVMEVKLTCVMTRPMPQTTAGTLAIAAKPKIIESARNADVVVIGPGLSQHPETRELTIALLRELNVPIVLDADGLNAVAGQPDVIGAAKNSIVLTPHPGELARLMNLRSAADVQRNRMNTAKQFVTSLQNGGDKDIVLALKGHETIVIDRNRIYVNDTGNPGMASAGSGDVLSGVVGALIGQGLSAFDAAQLGVHIHGLAGDIAAQRKGEISMIATDILDCLPDALSEYAE